MDSGGGNVLEKNPLFLLDEDKAAFSSTRLPLALLRKRHSACSRRRKKGANLVGRERKRATMHDARQKNGLRRKWRKGGSELYSRKEGDKKGERLLSGDLAVRLDVLDGRVLPKEGKG